MRNWLAIWQSFNSLSRDHRSRPGWRTSGRVEGFQLPLSGSLVALPRVPVLGPRPILLSTPSLGITLRHPQGPRRTRGHTFNSLSRDHLSIMDQLNRHYQDESFNSLSRDHGANYIEVYHNARGIPFQLPLSGSQTTSMSIIETEPSSFQLPLSGSLTPSSIQLRLRCPIFQLPLSGSQALCQIAHNVLRDFQLPLSGSHKDTASCFLSLTRFQLPLSGSRSAGMRDRLPTATLSTPSLGITARRSVGRELNGILLSTPSLGITNIPAIMSSERESAETFNSLSRDHTFIIVIDYVSGDYRAFNSLSRDHPQDHRPYALLLIEQLSTPSLGITRIIKKG